VKAFDDAVAIVEERRTRLLTAEGAE